MTTRYFVVASPYSPGSYQVWDVQNKHYAHSGDGAAFKSTKTAAQHFSTYLAKKV